MTPSELKAEKEKEAKIKAEIDAERNNVQDKDPPSEKVLYASYQDMLNQFSTPRWYLDGHTKLGDVLEVIFETIAANGVRHTGSRDDGSFREQTECNRPFVQQFLDLLAGPSPAGKVASDGASIGSENIPKHMCNRVAWYGQLSALDTIVPVPADGKGVPTRTIASGGEVIARAQ
jgi:hypothetical protein